MGGSSRTPEVVKVDPKAEADKAANEAQIAANAAAAVRTRSLRRSALSTGAGGGGLTGGARGRPMSALAYGAEALGTPAAAPGPSPQTLAKLPTYERYDGEAGA